MGTKQVKPNLERIENLEVGHGIKAIDIFLDAWDRYEVRACNLFIKTAKRRRLDEEQLAKDVYNILIAGNCVYDNKWIGESIITAYYMELRNKKAHLGSVKQLLSILAANGSKRSDDYRFIANDTTARNQ